MADVEAPAGSSPAVETPSSAPAEKPEPVSVPQKSEDYAQWRMTGKLPGKNSKPSGEDSAPSKSADDEEPPSGKGAPVSETGQPRQKRNADSRKEELNREIRDLLARRDSLRQETEGKPEGKQDVKAEPSPAPQEPQRPVKPKAETFKTWEEYETAQDKYVEELADWRAGERIREYTAKQQMEAGQREMQKRLDEAKVRYGEEAEPKIVSTARTVFDDKQIPPAIKTAIGRSKVITDALYVLGSDDKELGDFVELARQDPLEALRKWYTVESLVQQELDKQSKSADDGETRPRDVNGQFLAEKPPPSLPRKVSQAPPPATELNAKSSIPTDEVARAGQAAVKGTDPQAVRRYFEAKNRETLQKRRTG